MSENELRHATRATKEAARAFAASAAAKPSREAEIDDEVAHVATQEQPRTNDVRYDDVMAEGSEEGFESSQQSTPWQKGASFSLSPSPFCTSTCS